MYVFEFSAKLTQKDIADMWQNLPPDIGESFATQKATVEEKELIDAIVSKEEKIKWMVFKVKKRAKKDFEVYRRSLLTDNTTAMAPSLAGRIPESYNWPYDFFSLVELAKIDQGVQYVSKDLKQMAPLSDIEALDVDTTTIPTSVGASQQEIPAPAEFDSGIPGNIQGNVDQDEVGTPSNNLRGQAVISLANPPRSSRLVRDRNLTVELANPPAPTNPLLRRRGTYSEDND